MASNHHGHVHPHVPHHVPHHEHPHNPHHPHPHGHPHGHGTESDKEAQWDYSFLNGPTTWRHKFALAAGKNQSPININTGSAVLDRMVQSNPLHFSYCSERNMKIVNSGHTLRADVEADSVIFGGPMEHKYRLEQFHLHWGSSNDKGSEHVIDGRQYAAELHLVHWNSAKYRDFKDAAEDEDGLTVLAVLIKVGKEHHGFKALTSCLEKVKQKKQEYEVPGYFEPKCLLPSDVTRYWTYHGSLTTPPCSESVTWIVFNEIMEISDQQIKALRSLKDGETGGCCIENNYRPPQPLGDRKLKASFNE